MNPIQTITGRFGGVQGGQTVRKALAIAFVALLAFSVVAPFLGGLAIVDSDHDGTAAASSASASMKCDVALNDAVHSSPVFHDIDSDDADEIVVGDNAGYVHAIDVSSSGCSIKWSTQVTTSSVKGPVTIADADGDGADEIYVGYDADVEVLDTSGTILDTATIGTHNTGAITIADTDDDGALGIYVTGGPTLYKYTFDGSTLTRQWRYDSPVSGGAQAQDLTPPVADVDGDGTLELGFMATNHSAPESEFAVINHDGTVEWNQTNPRSSRVTPTFADIDGDGSLEFVSAFKEKNGDTTADKPRIVAYSASSGTEKWNRALKNESSEPDHIWPAIVASDVDQDGAIELVYGTHNDKVHVRAGSDGALLHEYDLSSGANPNKNLYNVETEPSLSDVDADGEYEIVVGTNKDAVMVFSPSLELEANLTVSNGLNEDFESSPAIADADGDGKLEIASGNFDGSLYVWEMDVDGGTPEWRAGLRRDTVETTEIGVLNTDTFPPALVSGSGETGQSVGLVEDDLEMFPPDDSELAVYHRTTEYKPLWEADGDSPEDWQEYSWDKIASKSFNWENKTRVTLQNGEYYRFEIHSPYGLWEDTGFKYDKTEMYGSTIWIRPDTGHLDSNDDGTAGGSSSSGTNGPGDGSDSTSDDDPTATEDTGFGPTALGSCTTTDGQDGVEVEYWDPGYETYELEANLSVDGSTTYFIHKSFDEARGYYRGCLADVMTNNASDSRDTVFEHNATGLDGAVVSSGSTSYEPPVFGPSGVAPASTGERLGLLAGVIAALGALWFGGNRYVPGTAVEAWPVDSVSPAFGVGAPLVTVLGLDLAGGGVISASVATGLAQIAPFAGVVGVTIVGYYALRWIRAPPS